MQAWAMPGLIHWENHQQIQSSAPQAPNNALTRLGFALTLVQRCLRSRKASPPGMNSRGHSTTILLSFHHLCAIWPTPRSRFALGDIVASGWADFWKRLTQVRKCPHFGAMWKSRIHAPSKVSSHLWASGNISGLYDPFCSFKIRV